MISFENVSKIYLADTVALENVSFKIDKGEFVVVAGKSGAGKTTLLKLLLAEEKPSQGQVFFDGKDVHRIKKGQLPYLRRKMGAVFQDYKLLSSKTVFENVAFVLEALAASDEEVIENTRRALEIVDLGNKSRNFPKQLSAGQGQRVAIARALVHRPEVILADEPTGNLDPYNTAEVMGLLLKINELGTTTVLATHNKELIKQLRKRTVVLRDGKMIRDDKEGRFIL